MGCDLTKKEKLEKLLQEIPCLYEDYQQGIIKRYSLFGKYDLLPEELNRAKSVVGKNKLLCVIEQDMTIEGERVSLINYVIDEKGFTPKKQDRINPAIFYSQESSNVNYKVDHHDNQIFDHPEAKFFVV